MAHIESLDITTEEHVTPEEVRSWREQAVNSGSCEISQRRGARLRAWKEGRTEKRERAWLSGEQPSVRTARGPSGKGEPVDWRKRSGLLCCKLLIPEFVCF